MDEQEQKWHEGGIFNPNTPYERVNIWGPTPPGKQSGEIVAKDVRPHHAKLIIEAVAVHAGNAAKIRTARDIIRDLLAPPGYGFRFQLGAREAAEKFLSEAQ